MNLDLFNNLINTVKESNMSAEKIKAIKLKEYNDEDCKEWEGEYEWMSEMK